MVILEVGGSLSEAPKDPQKNIFIFYSEALIHIRISTTKKCVKGAIFFDQNPLVLQENHVNFDCSP